MDIEQTVILVLQGQAGPRDVERVRSWRGENPRNEARYQELAGIWRATETRPGSAGQGQFQRPVPHPESLIRRAEQKTGQAAFEPAPSAAAGARTTERLPWIPVLAVAAAVAALVLGVTQFTSVAPPAPTGLVFSEISTGPDEMTTVQTADGTSIRLGPSSTLRLHSNGLGRDAWLEGRAFFGVDGTSSRPFTVHTAQGTALVRGTRFEVRTEAQEFRVLVVDGRVSVATEAGDEVELSESEMSRSRPGEVLRAERVPDVYQHLAWMGRTLVFQRTRVDRAIEEIEHRYGIEIALEDASLGDHRITATFTSDGLSEVVAVLCTAIGAECLIDEETGAARIGVQSSPESSSLPRRDGVGAAG